MTKLEIDFNSGRWDRRKDGQAENNRALPTFVGGAIIMACCMLNESWFTDKDLQSG